MNLYIGADLGTSSLKLMLTDREGNKIRVLSKSYDVYYPENLYSEQNANDWWDALVSGVSELTNGYDPEDVKGISISGQMHGLVALDEKDAPVRPVILWNDGRSYKETDYLNNEIGKETLISLTGNIAFPGFTAPKILWVKNNEPELFGRIRKIMLPKDFVNYKLTGVFASDYSDAAGTLLLDVKNKCWSEEMLKICSLTDDMLPRLYNSYEFIGCVKAEIAASMGLSKDTKVFAGGADNALAAIGCGAVGNEGANISIGTSGTLLVSRGEYNTVKSGAIHSFCHADGGYYLMGCMLSAASCNKWFYESILRDDRYDDIQGEIDASMLGENRVYFLPYLTGERSPINDPFASGMFIGLTPDTKRADMVLAILEGIAFAIKDSLEALADEGIKINKSALCGGGARSDVFRKILAAALDVELYIPVAEEGPAMGGAMLAMVGCGEYQSVEECVAEFVKYKESVKPDETLVNKYREKYNKYKKIYPCVKNLYKELY